LARLRLLYPGGVILGRAIMMMRRSIAFPDSDKSLLRAASRSLGTERDAGATADG